MESKDIQEDEDWGDASTYFSYPELRESQGEGILNTYKVASNRGFFVLEGACGTGKTALALSPLIKLVRSNKTDFKRVVVVTSVKQQQKAFEEELEKINQSLDEGEEKPITGLTLVGKSDVNPYSRHGIIEDIYEEDERLRDNTRSIIESGENPKAEAESLVSLAESMTSKKDWGHGAPDYPYPPIIPSTETGREFSPFYAKHVANSFGEGDLSTIPFNYASRGLIKTNDLVELAGGMGTDPHAVMGDLIEHIEVVIGNYYHIFEPRTVKQFTKDLISEETLLVVDEAHNLVPRVRELLSDSISSVSFSRAKMEAEQIKTYLNMNVEHLKRVEGVDISLDWQRERYDSEVIEEAEKAEKIANDPDFITESVSEVVEFASFLQKNLPKDVTTQLFRDYRTFIDDILAVIDKSVSDKLTEKYGDYWQDADPEDTTEIPLRKPDEPSEDRVSQYISLKGTQQMFRDAPEIGRFIDEAMEYFYTDVRDDDDYPTVYADSVGNLLEKWSSYDHTTFFREVVVEPRWGDGKSKTETGYAWEEDFNVYLSLKNCIPREKLSSRIDEFGGGVFMSATLEPLDVFKNVTGLSILEKERPVKDARYGLHFPEKNRESLAVEAPAFKYSARDQPYKYGRPNTSGNVRGTYSQAIIDVAKSTPGNVLISMPSYAEASWAGDVIRNNSEINKTVLVDESSSNKETEDLKQSFFSGSGKVLVTGARGTLVEGVDYEGDKLDAVLVIGVPLENSRSPYKQAIQTAYENYKGFKGKGFEYAFTIPAVRKARQSIGRVVRDSDDIGVRILMDERYTSGDRWDSVREWIPQQEKKEFQKIEPDILHNRLNAFWAYQEQRGAINK